MRNEISVDNFNQFLLPSIEIYIIRRNKFQSSLLTNNRMWLSNPAHLANHIKIEGSP